MPRRLAARRHRPRRVTAAVLGIRLPHAERTARANDGALGVVPRVRLVVPELGELLDEESRRLPCAQRVDHAVPVRLGLRRRLAPAPDVARGRTSRPRPFRLRDHGCQRRGARRHHAAEGPRAPTTANRRPRGSYAERGTRATRTPPRPGLQLMKPGTRMTRVTSTTAGSPSYAAASRRLASSAPATVHAAGSTCHSTCHRPTDERTTTAGIGTRPERTSRISRRDAPVAVRIEVDLQAPDLRHLAARAGHRRIDAAEHVAARLVRGAEQPLAGGMAPVPGEPGELPHPGTRTLAEDDRGVLAGTEQLREPLHGCAVPGRGARQARRAAHRPLPAAAPRAARSAAANRAGPAGEWSGCSTRTGYTARGDGGGRLYPKR